MFQGKKILVLGAAKSGISSAEILLRLGAQVILTDKTPLEEMPEGDQEKLAKLNIPIITGQHPESLLDGVDLIVKNPGIPPTIPFLMAARQRGIKFISELELAYLITNAEIVAITGTNGKTTTTALTGTLLSKGSRAVEVGGNIGLPLTSISYGKDKNSILVVETSSFQLEDSYEFKPRVAVYTNITPDHLDRHKTMENYIGAKLRLTQNQTARDYVVVNADDGVLSKVDFGMAQKITYSIKDRADCYIQDNWFMWQGSPVSPVDALGLPGGHNLQNALAAIATACIMGLTPELIEEGLRTFKGVEHRLEYVGEFRGIKFYNDSKATNPESVMTALASFEEKVLLLAGGYDKGGEFTELAPHFVESVKHLFAYGDTREKLRDQVGVRGFSDITLAKDLKEAFNKALEHADSGDIILLSPACASWDQFPNFEERGLFFKRLVYNLGG